MTERADRMAASRVPAPSRAQPRRAPGDRAPSVARVLALQRSAGNAAVNRLLRIPLDRPRGPAPPAAPTTARGRFEAQMRDRWSVANVRTGTEANHVEEMRRMTPDAQAAPASISAHPRP